MTARFRVAFAGPHVTVQDGGRPGLMRFGVPASGAMDRKALAIANLAAGNPPGAAVIEVSRGGLVLDCIERAAGFAVAGGGFVVQAGGRRLASWQTGGIAAGEQLVIRPGHWGSWCCLAFAGGLEAPEWLGARATHGPSGLGGGRLAAGQVLQVSSPRTVEPRRLPCPVWARPRQLISVVMGPQDRFFRTDARGDFLHRPFTVTEAGDRMGLRLSGPALPPEGALAIPSEPVMRGSVQVSGDGVATVLLADHQTTGGYPKIATLLDDDTDGLVQTRPGDALRFQAVTPEAAVALARTRAAAVARYLAALQARPAEPLSP